MKLDPGFINHWKTQHLLDELGGDGLVALLRLWGQAQIKREWKGLRLTAKRLAMETKWKADENHLFSVLTNPDAPWLDKNEDGTFDIHGFEEHQKQVIHLWNHGNKGGRPKKDDSSNNTKDNTKDIDTYSSSYSSSYPICKPNENHMVILSDSIKGKNRAFRKPTIKEIEEYSSEISAGINAEAFFDFYETKGWVIGRSPMKDWKACVRTWKRSNQQRNQSKTKNRFAGTQEEIELP
jgi:hypothetical protein